MTKEQANQALQTVYAAAQSAPLNYQDHQTVLASAKQLEQLIEEHFAEPKKSKK